MSEAGDEDTGDAAAESQRFLAQFFLVTGVLLSLLAGLNVAVDPRADFGTELVPPLSIRHRARRVELLSGPLDPPPKMLVLGSSRVWKVEPDFLQELLGLPAFVAGVDDARTEDHLAMARYALLERELPIELILLQLDVMAFHQDRAAHSQLVSEPALQAHLPPDIPWTDFYAPYLDTLTHGQLLESINTLVSLRSMQWNPIPDVVILPRGNILYQHREARIRQGTFPLDAHVQQTLGTFLPMYRGYEKLSRRRVGYFHQLVKLARSRGIELLGYLPPVHPTYEQVIRARTRYPRLLPDLRRVASQALTGAGTRYFDATSLESFGGDPALYYDGIHPREENNRRLMKVLFADRLVGLAVQ